MDCSGITDARGERGHERAPDRREWVSGAKTADLGLLCTGVSFGQEQPTSERQTAPLRRTDVWSGSCGALSPPKSCTPLLTLKDFYLKLGSFLSLRL
uniref:Uncharacterized protein n=1 Tax=Knipowitschia caucasica TaxID=637954 RepID=A0AAV2KFI9_KNICA